MKRLTRPGGINMKWFKLMSESISPYINKLGAQITELNENNFTMIIKPQSHWMDESINGTCTHLHNGIISTMIDHTGGFCAWSNLKHPNQRISTANLRVDFLESVSNYSCNQLEFKSRLLHIGHKIIKVDIICIETSTQKEIAIGRGSYSISSLSNISASIIQLTQYIPSSLLQFVPTFIYLRHLMKSGWRKYHHHRHRHYMTSRSVTSSLPSQSLLLSAYPSSSPSAASASASVTQNNYLLTTSSYSTISSPLSTLKNNTQPIYDDYTSKLRSFNRELPQYNQYHTSTITNKPPYSNNNDDDDPTDGVTSLSTCTTTTDDNNHNNVDTVNHSDDNDSNNSNNNDNRNKVYSDPKLMTYHGLSYEAFIDLILHSSSFITIFMPLEIHELMPAKLSLKLPLSYNQVGNPVLRALHGGITAALIDHTSVYCARSILSDIHTYASVSDIRIDYLQSIICESFIYCDAWIVHRSNRILRIDSIIYDDTRKHQLALGRATIHLFPSQQSYDSS